MVKTELPQLFTTVTAGVVGAATGAATPLPATLVQPLTVRVTVYVPGDVTLIELVLAPLLHNNVPVAVVVKTELPQLFTTVTAGAVGAATGAATPLPATLVQPLTVLVTVYVPGDVTVIEAVVAELLHRTEPEPLAVNIVLPQLFVTVTTGAATDVIVIFEPLSAPIIDGELDTTLILYPVPAGVAAGIVAAIVPAFIPARVPIATGDAKLPEAFDNWAVHILLLFIVPALFVNETLTAEPAQRVLLDKEEVVTDN